MKYLVLFSCVAVVHAGMRGSIRMNNNSNQTMRTLLHPQDFAQDAQARRQRTQERRQAFQESILSYRPGADEVTRVPQDEWYKYHGDRRLGFFGGSGSAGDSVSAGVLADPTEEYDKWAQAYRMLGGFIDCDHNKDGGSHDSGDGREGACSRWMLWASYVNPNYQGYEYDEYFGDNPTSTLDCHSPDTEWKLLGVYRQEFYQFIEQISKHLWAIDEYEYVTALAGLAYMSDDDCFYVGADSS